MVTLYHAFSINSRCKEKIYGNVELKNNKQSKTQKNKKN